MLNIVIFGPPGSGKGTQSKLLVEQYNLRHISTGDILRQEIQQKTSLGQIANQYIHQGQLVPDDVIIHAVTHTITHLRQHTPLSQGYIFDGFPRTLPQAEALDRFFDQLHTSITAVLSLTVDDQTLTQRLLHRAELENRTDDTPLTIQNRLAIYHEQTEPLKQYYQRQNKLRPVPSANTIQETNLYITQIMQELIQETNQPRHV
jgi:adenylate kinase